MKRILDFLKDLVIKERCPKRLALAFCWGNFIAFSPFLGLHTAMVFLCAWFFGLSLPIMLTVSMAINNIWTLIPIYISDYIFGYWFSHSLLDLNFSSLNILLYKIIYLLPNFLLVQVLALIKSTKVFFQESMGLPKPCLWSFLIGGNILGVVTSLVLYPILIRIFTLLAPKKDVFENV